MMYLPQQPENMVENNKGDWILQQDLFGGVQPRVDRFESEGDALERKSITIIRLEFQRDLMKQGTTYPGQTLGQVLQDIEEVKRWKAVRI